jgi:bacteriocin biosynthesis cyclodehydratase domain-containing protein
MLKPWLRTARCESRLVLEHARTAVVFEGGDAESFLPSLLDLLDGTRTAAEIAGALATSQEIVASALDLLDEHELLLAEALPLGTPDETIVAFLTALRGERAPATLATALRRASVGVVGGSDVARRLRSHLAHMGVRDEAGTFETPLARDLTLVAPAGHELPSLRDWNRAALRLSARWLLVLPFDGAICAIGPLFVPGETGCFECFERRRASSVAYPAEYPALARAAARHPQPEPVVEASAAFGLLVALRWLVWRDPELPGCMTALELSPVRTSQHRLLRVPRCDACAESARRSRPAPWFEPGAGEA